MPRIIWDEIGERLYETGVDHTVLYPVQSDGSYTLGVPWNGITAINENPSGGEANPVYADNIKYLNLMSAEDFGCTVEALMYPEEFAECDGSAAVGTGVYIGQQHRKKFGLCYRTLLGNDVLGTDYGYKLHLVYGGQASPSERSHSTVNESPEAGTMSWTVSTTAVPVEGYKATSHLYIDSTKVSADKLAALEDILYGSGNTEARLPSPDEVIAILAPAATCEVTATASQNAFGVAFYSINSDGESTIVKPIETMSGSESSGVWSTEDSGKLYVSSGDTFKVKLPAGTYKFGSDGEEFEITETDVTTGTKSITV